MARKQALLRVCASCEWVFKAAPGMPDSGCPKCGFGHYGAHYVYGKRAYRYATTQEPWIRQKMDSYGALLQKEIRESTEALPQRTALAHEFQL